MLPATALQRLGWQWRCLAYLSPLYGLDEQLVVVHPASWPEVRLGLGLGLANPKPKPKPKPKPNLVEVLPARLARLAAHERLAPVARVARTRGTGRRT